MRTDRRFKRGAYLLPSLFTVGNLFCGYFSVMLTLQGRFDVAAILIGIAAALDALDGRVARLTGTDSEFGREFDSLSDTLSFGLAPAVLVQQWALTPFGRVGWLVSFLFVACGVVRLARFRWATCRRWPAACTPTRFPRHAQRWPAAAVAKHCPRGVRPRAQSPSNNTARSR